MERLWGITAFFNSRGYRTRLRNHRVFRQRLRVPLVAVELAHGPAFELKAEDADVLIQLRGGDVLWQKERLLNVALSALPDECRAVAWLDGDVVFGRDDWPRRTLDLLESHPLVQPYRTVHHLAEGAAPGPGAARAIVDERAFAGLVADGGIPPLFGTPSRGRGGGASSGHAWAARREVLERHGLYDVCVLGGGDTALGYAAIGAADVPIRTWPMNAHQSAHYRRWAAALHRDVGGEIACLEGELYHLWHGSLRQRRYRDRHRGLLPFDFDPAADLALAEDGCWRWATPKAEMHRYVADYFASRREDGDLRPAPPSAIADV